MLKFRRHFLRAEFFICNFLFCQIYFTFLLFLLTKRSNRLRVLWPVFPPAFPGIKQRDTPIPPITSGTPPPETRITVWKHGLKTAKNTSKTSFYKLLFFRCLKTSKIQGIYFKIQGTYFKICALYFLRQAMCFFLCPERTEKITLKVNVRARMLVGWRGRFSLLRLATFRERERSRALSTPCSPEACDSEPAWVRHI